MGITTEKEFLTPSDLIELLPIGRDKVYQIIKSPSFPAIKFGKQYVVRREDLYEWWDEYKGKEFII